MTGKRGDRLFALRAHLRVAIGVRLSPAAEIITGPLDADRPTAPAPAASMAARSAAAPGVVAAVEASPAPAWMPSAGGRPAAISIERWRSNGSVALASSAPTLSRAIAISEGSGASRSSGRTTADSSKPIRRP